MIPYVIVPPLTLGPLTIQPFGILVALGIAIGCWLAARRARWLGLEEMDSFVVWILAGGFLGAHLLDSVFYHPDELVVRPWSILELWAGLSSFGASSVLASAPLAGSISCCGSNRREACAGACGFQSGALHRCRCCRTQTS